MLGFKFVVGATIPGKSLKRKPDTEEEKQKTRKQYEENRKERKLNVKWTEGREWLKYDNGVMICVVCVESNAYKQPNNLKGQNNFLEGFSNFRISTITDHEASVSHKAAVSAASVKSVISTSGENLRSTQAGKAYLAFKEAEIGRLSYLFRNIHAVMKNDKPITEFKWINAYWGIRPSDSNISHFKRKTLKGNIWTQI
ncbi:unnamed protein product [Mytilus coruscus]|uniref:C17orf113 probable zinc finger domain-containing protein n=1 Tax=Mytilus coruscus TaxID=42192 RepID=A0A6J8DII1_MYTCO|nr:unnamed protein product [Mytilus coruscus]